MNNKKDGAYGRGNDYWEKQIDKPISRVYDYSSSIRVDTINVYRLEDEVFETYTLIARDKILYRIGEKYYVRQNIFQKAFD